MSNCAIEQLRKSIVDEYLKSNREMWDDWAPLHAQSEFYDVEGFINGRCTLKKPELEEMGDVSGRSLLHLQCHFGLDTLSWARLGARVTGVDFSENAIEIARSLSEQIGVEAEFVCSNIYELPDNLAGEFDIVYTSIGALCWLNDIERWGEIVSHYIKPGGFFYILEGHPVLNIFDDSEDSTELKIVPSYFHSEKPEEYESTGSYAGAVPDRKHTSYEWAHSMSDIINALIGADLRIEFLHEFPIAFFKAYPFLEQDKDGYWRLEGDKVPMTFSLKATKP
ncbi:class I SAM-dependent methyltransferase [Chloroflexota bacterium]